MAERRAGTRGRRLGSSRRRQLREGSAEAPVMVTPSRGEDPPWAAQVVQRVQDLLREQDEDRRGFVTRSEVQKLLGEGLPCSPEELELIFAGLDPAGTGRIGAEEFTAGLRQFLSSHKAARDYQWQQKAASQRVPLVPPSPSLERMDSEEQRHFAAFMDQLGMDSTSEEQEVWQLWVKLRQDEPQLLGSLEDFLAKMRTRIQEAKSKKEALEATLNKHVAEHKQKVQQLCETLEGQMEQERQRLEQESAARGRQRRMELQRALDASEREVQSLVTAQRELEARCHRLSSTQRAARAENQQLEETNRVLEETNRVLEDQLQHLQQQLQQAHRNLQATRAAVAWEREEEPGDRAGTELPSEMPASPQMSLEKQRPEVRLGLGARSSGARSTHQVAWEVLPAAQSPWEAWLGGSLGAEEPSPQPLQEEGFSARSSLFREMNDAIAALSEHLKSQALAAPPAPTATAQHPLGDAEPQRGLEAAAAPGTTPEVLRESVPSTIAHELLEGDLREAAVAAELPAAEGPQAGGSVGAGHHGAQQGESPEEAWKMLFLQGKGPGVKELRPQVAEHLQGAPGESMEGEQVLVEGEGWMQEKAQPPGEAEQEALSQGESLEAGLGPPWAGQAGWQLARGEQPLGMGLGEEAEPPAGTPEEPEMKLGECPEPAPQGEAQRGAAQVDGALSQGTVALGPRVLEEELLGVEVQTQGEASGGDVPAAPAQHGGISRAEEEEVEVTQPREAEPQPGGEPGGGGAAGAVGVLVGVLVAVPPADVQQGGAGAEVQPLEAQGCDGSVQLPAELEAELQPPAGAGQLGMEQAGSMAPDVQPLEKDEPGLGLEEEMGTGVGGSEGPCPAGSPEESPELCGQSLAKAQALELLEAEDLQAGRQLPGGTSPASPQGGGGEAAMQLMEEAEDGAEGQSKPELPQEPGLDLQAAGVRQAEGAVTGEQPPGQAEILGTLQHQGTGAQVQLAVERGEPQLPPGGSMKANFPPLRELGSLGTEQGRSMAPGVQSLGQVHEPELVAMKAEGAQAEMQLWGDASLESSQGGEDQGAVQLVEEAEDETQGQGEQELPHGEAMTQGEGPGAGMQPPEPPGILGTLQHQSTDAKGQLAAELEELHLPPAGSTEADLHPLGELGSLGTEQAGSMAPDVQPLDQVHEPERAEREAEDAPAGMQLQGGVSSGNPRREEASTVAQLKEEAEDEGQEQDEHEVPQGPALGLQGEGAATAEPPELAGILGVLEEQGTDPKVQLVAEVWELRSAPGGSMKADLNWSEVGSLGTEQGLSVAPGVQSLGQVHEPELVAMKAEGAQAEMQLWGDASLGSSQGGGGQGAVQLVEEAEDETQGQGEQELPHGEAMTQGEGPGAGMQPPGEAENLGVWECQGTDAKGQLGAELEELHLPPAGSTEAEVSPLGAAGMQEGGSGLRAAASTAGWEGAAGACVSSLAEATSHPEHGAAPAPEELGLAAMLGPSPGPGGQIPEESQTLGILQGERAAAEEPLDGAQGLEVVQGERLEAGLRSSVNTRSPGLEQGRGAAVPVLATPGSERAVPVSVPQLEAVMQEDVLIPDVQLLGAPGQAAPREPREQVPAQADGLRLHTAPPQLEEKPPRAMEAEQVAASPAEPPEQGMAPVPALHPRIPQKEDAGNHRLGMVLGSSSPGDAGSSSKQPPRQLRAERSSERGAGRRGGEQRQAGQKVSREGEPEAVTAGGAAAAPGGRPEAPLDSDHLYNVLFVGDSHVGKTSFLYRLHADAFNPQLAATVGLDYQVKTLVVDNMHFTLRLWDSAGQERYRSVTRQFFRKADGVVLMYDLTSQYSFLDLRYWLSCVQEGAGAGVAVLLLGNKTDCAAEREVPREEGERLAKEHQLMFYECSAATGHNVSESMASLVRLLKVREDELKPKAEEVGKSPQKRKGCCW